MKQGDFVHLNWTPNAGQEMGFPHYGVVLSCKQFNENVPKLVVAPVTSKYRKEFGGLRIQVSSTNSDIHGFICLDHVRSVDPKARNLTFANGSITPQCLLECKEVLKKIFAV